MGLKSYSKDIQFHAFFIEGRILPCSATSCRNPPRCSPLFEVLVRSQAYGPEESKSAPDY